MDLLNSCPGAGVAPSPVRIRSWRPALARFLPWSATFPWWTPAGTIYTNTASVETDTFDPNGKNNSASTATTVTERNADMRVTKLASADQVLPDTDVTYTITVTNGGPNDAVNATVSDTLPGNMTFVSLSPPAGLTCSTPARARGAPSPVSNRPRAHRGEVFNLVGPRSRRDAVGTNYTTWRWSARRRLIPIRKTTCRRFDTVTGQNADLGVSKVASADEVLAGSNTLHIQVFNGGPSNALNATLNDTLPGNMTSSLVAAAGWTCSSPGRARAARSPARIQAGAD